MSLGDLKPTDRARPLSVVASPGARIVVLQLAKELLAEFCVVDADTESTLLVAALRPSETDLIERHVAENSTEWRLLSDPLREREPSESAPVGGTAAQDARSKRGQPSCGRRAFSRAWRCSDSAIGRTRHGRDGSPSDATTQ